MSSATRVPTPELDRVKAVNDDEKNVIVKFLEWAGERGYCVSSLSWASERQELIYELPYDIERLLAEFYDINLRKVEEERESLLAAIRHENHVREVLKRRNQKEE